MPLETRIYQKENNKKISKLLAESLRDIGRSRFLARQLAERDIKAQYRQSYLGIIWAFISPLATAVIWIILNKSGTIRITDTGIPYPVFAFAGTLIWSILTESINAPTQSTQGAKAILSKINFPREALIISGVYKLLFNSMIKIILLFAFIFLFDIGFNWTVLLVPFAILAAILIGTTIGLFLTPVSMLYNDVGKIISFGMRFLMYATPVVYAVPKEGILKVLMEINPLTPIIVTTRDFLTGMPADYLEYFVIVFISSAILFMFALTFYRLSIPIITER